MNRKLLITGAILGVLGIVLGAFAAHGLEKVITKDALDTFETGVRYQMYHALLLLILGSTNTVNQKTKLIVLIVTLIGIVFFAGSIFALATNCLTGFDFRKIAMITPIGGLLLIGSWALLLVKFIGIKND